MSEGHWMAPDRAPLEFTLEANDVAYSYRANDPVLRAISAQIKPGSFLAILGMNGCGKSTLLSCLDDIIRPQRGTILLSGRNIVDYSREERAQHIALVAQHSHANGTTVYDTLLLGRKPYIKVGPSDIDHQVVEHVISELNLEDLALRNLDELSGGEYQKVVIARALVQDTEIILLDEPTNNLDLANQVEVMELIHHVSREHGLACAAVLHDINLALRYCDRFLLIKDGEVLADGGHEVMTKEAIEETYAVKVDLLDYEGAKIVIPKSSHHDH